MALEDAANAFYGDRAEGQGGQGPLARMKENALKSSMRSRARFKGHPIHAMLIPFPIAFFLAAFFFDLWGFFGEWQRWAAIGAVLNILGIISALAAAVPGMVDYVFTVPPQSSGKKRATKHMLANIAVVLLFAVAWWVRNEERNIVIVILEGLGSGLLGYSGWLGGTLAYRNQIGVDHRYANKGKWREASIAGSGRVLVAQADELQVNQMKLLRLKNRRIVLARTEDGYVAFDDHCTHRGGSLADGVMICKTVQCPWHGSQFDVESGHVKAGPAKEPTSTHKVELTSSGVELLLT